MRNNGTGHLRSPNNKRIAPLCGVFYWADMKTLLQLYRDNAQREKRPVNVVNGAGEATIYIYGIISADWGIGAMDVVSALASVGNVPVLNVRIASPGGDVFESRAMMNALKRFEGKKIAHIDSICASAATSIALSCDEVQMASDAMYMIHNVQGGAYGEKKDLRETADLMEAVEQSIVKDYASKTGKDEAEIMAMMDAETWMTADEAFENGFVDRVENSASTVKNAWNLAAYAKVPANLTSQHAPEPVPVAGIESEFAVVPAIDNAAPQIPPATINSMTQANRNRLALLEATS